MSRVASAGGPAAEPAEATRPKKRKLTGWRAFLRDVAVILVAAIVISFLIKTFLIRSFYIPSASMEDTLQINDRIIVNELQPRPFPLSRGDVVVFRDPGGWIGESPAAPAADSGHVGGFVEWLGSIVGLTSPDSNDHLIKRVIGLPGDRVACCNSLGQMTVNGVPIKEPYIKLPPGTTTASEKAFSVTVPKDSLWVMGDNRTNSRDSRYHQDDPGRGFVPYGDVVGRAVVISWPVSRWTWLDDYAFVFADVGKRRSG